MKHILTNLLTCGFDDGLVGAYCGHLFKSHARRLYDLAYDAGLKYRNKN